MKRGSGGVFFSLALLSSLPALAQSPAIPPNTDDGYFVSANYFADFGRAPDPAGWIYHVETHPTLDKYAFINGFLASPEYAARFGTPDLSTFVTLLYQNALLRQPALAEVNAWVALLNATTTKAQAVDGFINSLEFIGNANGTYAAAYHTDYATPDHLTLVGGGIVGSQQLVTVSYTNAYGASDIAYGQIIVARAGDLDGSSACYVIWDKTGTLILTGEGDYYGHTGVNDPLMQNPQCSVNGADSHITPTAAGYDVTLALTFKSPFIGTHSIFSFGLNNENLSSPWANLGTLVIESFDITVPASLPSR